MLFTIKKLLIFSVFALGCLFGRAQRTYKAASVLASGSWYRVAVGSAGIHKIDLPLLQSLGLGSSQPSDAVRLYGKRGAMLPENNSLPRTDDLEECSILVADGGDGILNGSDYILFYSNGPHTWEADGPNRTFHPVKNLYSDKTYYYITVGGTGKRVGKQAAALPAGVPVTSFDERYVHELDSVNFLAGGKDWFGEEFSAAPGRTLTHTFTPPFPDLLPGGSLTLVSRVAARSAGAPSGFSVAANGAPVQQVSLPAVGGGPLDLFATSAKQTSVFPAPSAPLSLGFTYTPGGFNSQGWLDRFQLYGRRKLVLPAGGRLLFRDWQTVGQASVEFLLSGAGPSTRVWDVTDGLNPVEMNTVPDGPGLRFRNEATVLREYAAATADLYPVAEAAGRVPNQNLHAAPEVDYLIITHPSFASQAERLAAFHRDRSGLRTLVVTTEQVFHEFSAGVPDPTALRDFVKMIYDRQKDRWTDSGKYLLLFGKGSYDYKNRVRNNTALVPAWESSGSLDPLNAYPTDDFYGFLDDGEDINSGLQTNLLDIGIGRVPARSEEEARNFVDKVVAYHAPASFGSWRNVLTLVADDEDQNLHLEDAEVLAGTATAAAPVFNLHKIYLDAFRQESGSAGGRYPAANEAINNGILNGNLIWNYSGHGGPSRLAEEVVLDQSIVNNWNNAHRLPLFITATCDFAPFDHPGPQSLGEHLLVRPATGAIALMTTTRVVFAFSNRILNTNYLQFALQADSGGQYKSLGEAVRLAKNYTYQTSGDLVNNRKFVLLGDPAMTLGFPRHRVRAVRVNGRDLAGGADTLSAAEKVVLEGEVTDARGNLLPDFNGPVSLQLFDKAGEVTTLANDPGSRPATYTAQSSTLFRGKVTASGGRFSVQFRMPKDINFRYGNGRISLYAHDSTRDGNGFSSRIIIGGIDTATAGDAEGPVIRAYLNDESFVNGGITNEAPVLVLKLADSSGVKSSNSGIDHDIVATLDNNNQQYYVLNDFYETELDSYQRGSIRFQLPQLKPGPHSLKIKAWDVLNNSSEYVLDFVVLNREELVISHVLNYPNPFTTRTAFWFEHNQPRTDLNVKVDIFTITGKAVKTISRTINTEGNRSSELEWDGKDEFGDKPGRGVYLYRLTVIRDDGKKAQQLGKLVLLN